MKLDRNKPGAKHGKYALIKLRTDTPQYWAMVSPCVLVREDAIDYGDTPETEFFVIRLKDKYAAPALIAYAKAAEADDPEYAADVWMLALTAGNHPNKKKPD